MPATTSFKKGLEAMIRLVYPAFCGTCKTLLDLDEEVLCRTCEDKLLALQNSPDQAPVCESFEYLDEAYCLFAYKSSVRTLLTKIKFSSKRWLTRAFKTSVEYFSEVIGAETSYDGIIPIPIDTQKLLEREFNQTELFGQMVAQALNMPLRSRLLKKRFSITPQNRLSRQERLANTYGVFKVAHLSKLKGQSFLLIDDILTTGATAEEAARVLKAAGARRVDLLSIAYTETNTPKKKILS